MLSQSVGLLPHQVPATIFVLALPPLLSAESACVPGLMGGDPAEGQRCRAIAGSPAVDLGWSPCPRAGSRTRDAQRAFTRGPGGTAPGPLPRHCVRSDLRGAFVHK